MDADSDDRDGRDIEIDFDERSRTYSWGLERKRHNAIKRMKISSYSMFSIFPTTVVYYSRVRRGDCVSTLLWHPRLEPIVRTRTPQLDHIQRVQQEQQNIEPRRKHRTHRN